MTRDYYNVEVFIDQEGNKKGTQCFCAITWELDFLL